MDVTTQTLPVARGPYKLHAEVVPGTGAPIVLMHGFPDNTHLYDRLVPHLAGRRPVVRFDFLGWGRSDKPQGYPYTSANQVGDLAAVISAVDEHFGDGELVLVAHDASGLPAIDWALANPGRIEKLVLLNTYYHWTPALRRPRAIALYSTPVIRTVARALVLRRPDLDRRLYAWQVGGFIQDPEVRGRLVPQLYEQFLPGRRSGGSTTTCSARYSPAADASRSYAASPARSRSSSAAGTGPSTPGRSQPRRAVPPQRAASARRRRAFVQVDQPQQVADLIAAE
jgi:haloalkane dehalogenase